MPLEAGRCAWEVTAGILLGTVDTQHTRRWSLTSSEWDDGRGYELFLAREAAAGAYARYLQELCCMGKEVNWVSIDFVWY